MELENGRFDDERLDQALKKYGRAEPRAGLESRIVANLAAERERRAGPSWRLRFMAATLAFGVVAVVGYCLMQKLHSLSVRVVSTAPITNRSQGVSPPKISDHLELRPPNHRMRHPHIGSRRPEVRFEQFPSPRPLNEQEEMLARYVRERRQEAVLVARARAELLKQELPGFLGESPSSGQARELQQ
jgi:hypothetical protein